MIDIKLIIGFIAGIVVANVYPVVASTIYKYVMIAWTYIQGVM